MVSLSSSQYRTTTVHNTDATIEVKHQWYRPNAEMEITDFVSNLVRRVDKKEIDYA